MSEYRKRIAKLSPAKLNLLSQRLNKSSAERRLAIQPRSKVLTNLPLSFAQQRLWFLDQLEPGNPFYNIHAAVRLRGPIQASVIERCLNEIVVRHEILRASIHTIAGQPAQVIAPSLIVPLPITDLSVYSESQRESMIRTLAIDEACKPFDLSQGPLFRMRLLYLGENDHVFVLVMHHIISDGWSVGVFISELMRLYQDVLTGNAPSLPELKIQYVDFALWQRQWLRGEVLEKQLAYWKRQLAGSPPLIELPSTRPRPAVQTFKGLRRSFQFPPSITEPLKSLGIEEGATLFMTLLAALKTLIYRYTWQEDMVIGTGVANRTRTQTEGLIGLFVNLLVLRTDMSGNPTFRELLRRVKEVTLTAYAHQDLPFETLVDKLQYPRTLKHTPLFQLVFLLQNAPISAPELPGLTFDLLEIDRKTAHFDLGVFMEDRNQSLAGIVEYNTDIFEDETITGLIEHFETLLNGIAANPDCRLLDLSISKEGEKTMAGRASVAHAALQNEEFTF